MQAEAFTSACVVYLVSASLNRLLIANKVRDHGRHGRVEADYVEHTAVVLVSISCLMARGLNPLAVSRFTDNPNSTARRNWGDQPDSHRHERRHGA